MNRLARRSLVALILVAVLGMGLVFFVGEYFARAQTWVLFSGSPHVYSGGRLGSGLILDRDGALLLDLSGDKQFSPNEAQRTAMLHWTGDRQGNIRPAFLTEYARRLVGFDVVNGVYTYADAPGRMTLTLSSSVQIAALEALGDFKGTIGVYNYKTGELICAVSTPSFDPENVPDIANDSSGTYEGVYLNRFLQSVYIPGSIFKIMTLCAAVESVPDLLSHSFTCTGEYAVGTGSVTCEEIHAEQTLKEAFANSCNCAFAQIVELVGKEKLARCAEQFGVTRQVSFDGITTAKGHFDITDAYGELLAWSGIGQHTDQINPCAYLTFLGAVANGGAGVEPYVVAQVKSGGKVTYRAAVHTRERILSAATAELVKQYMRNNVQTKYGDFPGLEVCAKSGTGQVGGGKRSNAMMAGFVADEKYPFAFIVCIEEGGYGGSTCVPILAQVLAACKQMVDEG